MVHIVPDLCIETRDPLSDEALSLLHEAALEARRLYSDLFDPAAPMPTFSPQGFKTPLLYYSIAPIPNSEVVLDRIF